MKHRNRTQLLTLALAFIVASATLRTAFGDIPQPKLKITTLGSNQYSVTITNGVTNANYELYWTPQIANPQYPWQLLMVGSSGQTNFSVDGGPWPAGFFLSGVGLDWDADGVPNYLDANPYDASVGILTLTIDSPVNGSALQ